MSTCYPARSYNLNSARFLNLADALFGGQAESEKSQWTPPVDVSETPDRYEVAAELPGVNGADVKVVVRDGVLTLSGERQTPAPAEDGKTHLTERRYGSFQRRFTLPKDADGEQVSAEYRNGILTIAVPKREQVKPREIEIKIAS